MPPSPPPAGDGPLLLGVDLGSSRVKALLLDGSGREAGTASVPAPFRATGDGGSEATVDSLEGALDQALAGLPDRGRVVAVGLAGMAESGAPLDGRRSALAPVIAWHDRRGEDVARRLTDGFGPELARRIGQPLRYVSSVAKLGWLLAHGVSGVDRWLGVPELCLRSLTGAEATEWSLAARSGCRAVGDDAWIAEVAEAAGFPVSVFPEVRRAGEVMGRITPGAARACGLPVGIPVTVAGHDHLVGMLGSGAGTDDLANSVGTAETVVGRSANLPDVPGALERGLAVSRFPGGREWAVLASAARSGQVLEAAAAGLGDTPAGLDRLSVGSRPLEAPGLAASLRRREPPLLPDGPPGAVWRTLLDQLAALTVAAAGEVLDLVGPRRRLVAFGGGASSLPWLAAKAALAPLPVWRMTTPEAVARGAALGAGTAAGWWSSLAAGPPPPLRLVEVPPHPGEVTAGG